MTLRKKIVCSFLNSAQTVSYIYVHSVKFNMFRPSGATKQ
ncbi:hypothetical protein A5865_001107 [Enterococcus sp. 12E11_DIV0728]|nr:hypothetical protein A5865_001107 [Enterococcus sp. 12E11_DIV0728]